MRPRYGRRSASSSDKNEAAVAGHRHGHRSRSLTGTFGRTEIAVPRARLLGADGKTREWKSKVLRTYQRRTLAADALIASAYLAGTNTRRVRRALKALFAEGIGKDVVSRVWRKVRVATVIGQFPGCPNGGGANVFQIRYVTNDWPHKSSKRSWPKADKTIKLTTKQPPPCPTA